MGLCLLRDRTPRKNTGLAWLCASWGADNQVKKQVWYGCVPLGGAKTM